MREFGVDQAVGSVRCEFATIGDGRVQHLSRLRIQARAKRGHQAVDDLLVIVELVLRVLRRFHNRAQERNSPDVVPRDLFLVAALDQGGILDVVIGQGFERGIDDLVAGLDVVCLVDRAWSGCR